MLKPLQRVTPREPLVRAATRESAEESDITAVRPFVSAVVLSGPASGCSRCRLISAATQFRRPAARSQLRHPNRFVNAARAPECDSVSSHPARRATSSPTRPVRPTAAVWIARCWQRLSEPSKRVHYHPSPYNCALFQIQETPDVDTSELISAAASIAGHLAARAFATGSMSSDEIQQIARTAVQIAREIENEARQL